MTSVQKIWPTPLLYKTRDLTVLKAYLQDIQNHLDLALVRTSDTGQLDISTLSAPDWTQDRVSIGYLIYRFDDPIHSTYPIFMRIEFYSMLMSSYTSNTTTYQSQGGLQTEFIFGTGTDGAGTVTNPSTPFYSPYNINYGDAAHGETTSHAATRNGANYLSYSAEQGFLFFIYGSGAQYQYGSNNLALNHNLAMIVVQRTVDEYGQQDGRGFVVIGRNTAFEGATANFAQPLSSTYLYTPNTWTTQDAISNLSPAIGENLSTYWNTSDSKFLVYPVKYWDPDLGVKDIPNLLYIPNLADYPGNDYTVETIPNRPRRFRSLGQLDMWRPTYHNWGDYNCVVLWQ